MSPGLAVPAWHAAANSRAARKSRTMSGSSPPTTTGLTRSKLLPPRFPLVKIQSGLEYHVAPLLVHYRVVHGRKPG